MARFKSPYDEDREVPSVGRIITPGEVFAVDDGIADSFRNGVWVEVDSRGKTIPKPEPEPDPEPAPDPTPDPAPTTTDSEVI